MNSISLDLLRVFRVVQLKQLRKHLAESLVNTDYDNSNEVDRGYLSSFLNFYSFGGLKVSYDSFNFLAIFGNFGKRVYSVSQILGL